MNYLQNYLINAWQPGSGRTTALLDPVTGQPIATVGGPAEGLDAGFAFARTEGAGALQTMTYGQRAGMLGEVLKVLQANRDAYYDISLANSGTTKADSAVDIEGAAFTLGYYAKIGAGLGDAKTLLDGSAAIL